MKKISHVIMLLLSVFLLTSCSLDGILNENGDQNQNDHHDNNSETILSLDDLEHTEAFRKGALEHILEGELNRKGQAVGFHYDGLPTKKGTIISGTETEPNEYGVYEAEVEVSDVAKTSNGGKSTFFPDEWTAQDVVDAINEAHENSTLITGNTYEGLTDDGLVIRMYLDQHDQIISAFPVY